MKTKFLLLIGLLCLNSIVHAEGGCPPGMIPYSGTDISSCGPIPPGYYNNQNQQVPSARWASKWGAIASDGAGHITGASSNKNSEQEAQNAAIEDCRAYGGQVCKPAGTYSNQCISIVSGDTYTDTIAAATVEQANEQGMQRCGELNQKDCHVYYSACSLPERIQ